MAIKVLHCPANVGSQASTLAAYERKVGLDSVSYTYLSGGILLDTTNSIFIKDKGAFGNEVQAWKFLFREAVRYDVIHYNFGSTIIPVKRYGDPLNPRYPQILHRAYEWYRAYFEQWELPWLLKKGKKIFVTFQGDDARLGSYQLDNYKTSMANDAEYKELALRNEDFNIRMAQMFSRYAERMYALNPDLLQTLPRKAQFLPYASVDIEQWRYVGSTPGSVLRVAHAPTQRNVKGTKYVIDAVERLKNDGVPIELILIENMSRSEARKAYEIVDLGVDQLLGGWYGGLGLEFMCLGKPVIAYIREEDMKFIPSQMRADLPVINAEPGTIYDVLKEWATAKKHLLPQLGMKSREFAETWHHPLKIAQRLKSDYEVALGK